MKIVIIIGGSCGFGCNVVLYLVKVGYGVVLIYCGNVDVVVEVVVQICVQGGIVYVLLLDMVQIVGFV